MNSIDAGCRAGTLDSPFLLEVSDLVASSVVGGALAGVNATASAFGDPSLAWTNTRTIATQFGSGGSIAMGWGTALASGNNPVTNVSVFGAGNAVLAYTTTTNFSTTNNSAYTNLAISTGFVVAYDNP